MAAALKHLQTARRLLACEGFLTSGYAKPIISCIAELCLIVQVSLPFPFTSLCLDRTAETVDDNISTAGPLHELQRLLDIVCSNPWINFAIWSPMSRDEANIGREELQGFHQKLEDWEATSVHIFKVSDRELSSFRDSATRQPDPCLWPSPPESKEPQCSETALAAILYHCYMGRILWMLSSKSGDSERDRAAACFHAYQILCLSNGIIKATSGIQSCQCRFLSHNAVKISLIPVLYFATRFSFTSTWQHLIIKQLYCLGQEGLYDGASFARTLECAPLFDTHARRTSMMASHSNASDNAFDPDWSSTMQVLIRSAEGTDHVAYYLRKGAESGSPTEGALRVKRHIIGKACWTDTQHACSSDILLHFFGPEDPINTDFTEMKIGGDCIYTYIASQEPLALEWATQLGKEASSPHGYFEHLAGLLKLHQVANGRG